jgi:hypothetical protein
MPKLRKGAAHRVKLMQSHAPSALAGVVSGPTPQPRPRLGLDFDRRLLSSVLRACARVAYESFVREAGYAKDARIPAFDSLKEHQKMRWENIAQKVLTAAGLEEVTP